jgi:hypothetical protein
MAALKKQLFDEGQKIYYDLENKEVPADKVKKSKFKRNKGGIIVFPKNAAIMLKYLDDPTGIFKNRDIKKILKKYPEGVFWHMGNRYRGVYKNELRDITFNSESDTLEILELNSGDLINIAVKIAVEHKQSILLIKDLNNETMLILGHQMNDAEAPIQEDIEIRDELTEFDIKKMHMKYNNWYKLCKPNQHTYWEMFDVYPNLNEFRIEDRSWWGR